MNTSNERWLSFMVMLLTIITCVLLLLCVAMFLYKKYHRSKYDKQKHNNLSYLKAELEEMGYDSVDIDSRIAYANDNYVSDNAGDMDNMLYQLVTSQDFYENQKQHYTNQDS